MAKKYWVGVASRERVKMGVKGGYAQVCHGKGAPLKRMAPGDWIIYYCPAEIFGGRTQCRKFTAIGTIDKKDPYEFCMSDDFTPWRRDVTFKSARDVSIEPLINDLKFIKNKKSWGFPFRRGCFEITEQDFKLIAKSMGVNLDE